MKIDKAKLNTLLRSGLNPEVKTRKQLAAYLELDPTSLTRWFAKHDRLGNPRYPVVPDRHVTNILQIFSLEIESLGLNDVEFRQHCFEIALRRSEENNNDEQKEALRKEQIALRKLTLPESPTTQSRQLVLSIIGLLVLSGLVWFYLNMDDNDSSSVKIATSESQCWTGYSKSLGNFDNVDEADPCHYGKLLHNAVKQLKSDNDSQLLSRSKNIKQTDSSQTARSQNANKDYILFLSQKLELRQLEEKIRLNIELGRNKLAEANHSDALQYFQKAQKILASIPKQKQNQKLIEQLSVNLAAANIPNS